MATLEAPPSGRTLTCSWCRKSIPPTEKHVYIDIGRYRHRRCYRDARGRPIF
jgi:hypothetical protein